MIGAGYPAGIFTLHAGAAYQNILDGIIQTVTHVKDTGNIRGRDDHGKRFPVVGRTIEITFIDPVLVPAVLRALMFEIFTQFHVLKNGSFLDGKGKGFMNNYILCIRVEIVHFEVLADSKSLFVNVGDLGKE